MNKFYINLFIFLILPLGIFSSSFVLAEEAPEITFPVAELGNCKDKTECFAFCELPENEKNCLAFAKEHNLLSEEEIRIAEKVQSVGGGPGNCKSKDECEAYCDDVSNIEECLKFAEENDLMKGKDLEEARKVRDVLKSGGKLPGNCKNKNACESYCQDGEHMEECLAFAEQSGFLSSEELAQARKFMPLMKSGQTPGNCKSKDECEAYCENDANFEECITFAEKHDMIPEGDKKNIEAFKKAGGRGPGGCKGRQCETFCEQPDHQKACFEWAKENGLIDEEDIRHKKENRGQREGEFVGPGGCTGPEECMVYCKDNPEECKKFAPPQEEAGREMHRENEGERFNNRENSAPIEFRGEDNQFRNREESEFQHESGEQYQQEFQKQYDQEYKREYEEQREETLQRQDSSQGEQQFQ